MFFKNSNQICSSQVVTHGNVVNLFFYFYFRHFHLSSWKRYLDEDGVIILSIFSHSLTSFDFALCRHKEQIQIESMITNLCDLDYRYFSKMVKLIKKGKLNRKNDTQEEYLLCTYI